MEQICLEADVARSENKNSHQTLWLTELNRNNELHNLTQTTILVVFIRLSDWFTPQLFPRTRAATRTWSSTEH
jgi:hypothetical protein